MTGQQGVPQVDVPAPGLGALVTEEDITAFAAVLCDAWGCEPADAGELADASLRAALEAYGARLLARVGRNPGYPQVLGGFIAAGLPLEVAARNLRRTVTGTDPTLEAAEIITRDAARTPHATAEDLETGL